MNKLAYLSKTDGIGGSIKQTPQDFKVEEISAEGQVLEIDTPMQRPDLEGGRFLHFVLQKTDWNTAEALRTMAKRLRMSFKRFNFAGTKDKTSVSTQLCSCFALRKEALEGLRAKDIRINGMWYAKDKVRLGQLLGNRFTIRVEGMADKAPAKTIAKIRRELGGRMPNYFGEQRFGSTRRNTHVVGEKIIRNRMAEAAWIYLTDSEGENNGQAKAARKMLEEHHDFGRALREYPKHLDYERMLLEHLSRHPGDYANAFRRLPRNLLLLFIHAFQADLFNRLLSGRLAEGSLKAEEGEYYCAEDAYGFPDIERRVEKGWLAGKLIGYETPLNEREGGMLAEAGISPEAFKMRHMPEIHSRGTYRPLLVPLKDFGFMAKTGTFRFSLPSGSYATVAMREFLDKEEMEMTLPNGTG